MEENELGSSEVESSSADANSETSSESQTSTTAAPQKEETNLPFHEHPRWKEIVDQKNSYAAKAQDLEAKYAEMSKQIQELSKPKDNTLDKRSAMIERLKGIDPDFAEFIAELAPQKSVTEVKAAIEEERQQQFRTTAVSEINKMHADNKVDPALQAKYNQELELAYATGKIRSMSDVSSLYKQIHEGYSKLMEDIRRKDRESYVKDKKSDTRTPSSQPKGKPAQASNKFEFSKNKEEARAQIVARYLAESKASSDV